LLEKGYEVYGIKRRISPFDTDRIDPLDLGQSDPMGSASLTGAGSRYLWPVASSLTTGGPDQDAPAEPLFQRTPWVELAPERVQFDGAATWCGHLSPNLVLYACHHHE